MTVQHFIRRILVLFFLLCLPATVLLAASESYIQTLTGKIKQGDSCVVIDDKFVHLSLNDWNSIQHLSVDNIVSFELRFDTSVYYQSKSFTCTLNVSVKYFTSRDQTVPDEINNVNLVVKYDTAKGAFYPANAHYKFKNAFKVVVVVNSITSQEWGNDIPAVFRLKNQILVERKYPFNPNATGPLQADITNIDMQSFGGNALTLMAAGFFTGVTTNSDQLVVSWNPADFGNPEEYDIEWAFIDKLSTNGQAILSTYANGGTVPKDKALQWMVNDNSRVTIRSSSYTINLPYPDGYVLVRVRGVSYQAVTNLRLTGIWDNDNGSGFALCAPVTAQEPGMNYQYSAAFAEEGKRKEVITYFDATLRQRQAVTLSNSDQTKVPNTATDRQETATVLETIYDQMGRPAVNVLPAPTNSKSLNYYQNFNLNSSGNALSHTDITLNNTCTASVGPLSVSSGAGQYYSPGNPFLNDPDFYFTKYVPDAQQYPYALTQYMPDNTGRVRRQSGVGYTLRNGSGRETRYFYSKPGQRELYRIFGMEVGDCSHYLKNVVVDPNGQASVSYIDANGKTIATALAGGRPDGVDALPSAAVGQPRARINETVITPANFTRNAAGMVMTATSTFTAEVKGTFDLHYSVNPAALVTTHSLGQFCSNCYYDVLVEVRNDCGTLVNSATTAPFTINDVTCNPNAAPAPGTLNVVVDELGVYTVTYTLRLSQDAINYQTDYYINNNSDLKKLQAFFEEKLNAIDLAGCYTTCEACKTLGSTPDAFRQKVLDLLATSKFSGVLATPAVQQWITDTWNTLKTNCANISCNVTSACDDYLIQMKQDVKPGGQYALYSVVEQNDVNVYSYVDRSINVLRFYNLNDPGNTEIYNFSYVDDNGNTVLIRELSESDFIRAYIDHPEWADMFVKKHIEYCSYLFCKDQSYSPVDKNNESSYNFDRTIRELSTGDDAISRGYFNRSNIYALVNADPFFNGGRGSGLKTSMITELGILSDVLGIVVKDNNNTPVPGKNILQFIDWMLYCKPNTNPTDYNAVYSSWTSCNPSATCRSTTLEWEFYRNYYLQLKSKYVNQVKAQVSPGCTDCFIGKDALLSASNTSMLLSCAQNGSNVSACPAANEFYSSEGTALPPVIETGHRLWQIPFHIYHSNGNVTRDVNITVNYTKTKFFVTTESGSFTVTMPAGTSEVLLYETDEWYDDNGDHAVSDEEITSTRYQLSTVACPAPPNVRPSSVCLQDPNYALYQDKHRIFNDFIDLSSYLNCLNETPTPTPTDAEVLDQVRADAVVGLDDMRNLWAEQLRAARDEEAIFSSISDNTISNLADDLKAVAQANIQYANTRETIRAASTVANGGATSKGFHSFAEVFSYYISSSLISKGFSEDLLSGPFPYDKNPIGTNLNSGEINSTICSNLTALKNRYTAAGSSGSFYDYLKLELDDDMVLTSAQLQDLETRCAAGCRYLNEPVLLPVALSTPAPTNPDHPFVSCSRVTALKTAFLQKYPGIDQSSKLYRVLFTNYCNHALGYALTSSDYIAFTEKCLINNTAVLYNKPASPIVPVNDFICQGNSIMTAYEQAGQEYDRYIVLERQRFRNLYISKCLGTDASATIEGEQYEYHYTLYYYDQSGNLVKTIPPEGVRFLTESQIDQIETMRKLGISTCEDDGITKVADKTAALNTVSSVLQSNSAKAIELWLSNIDAVNGGQVRFITPDNKYMYQAAIANKKLWVELYSLQPGTSGDITVTLSNQMVADISSITIQKWSHVVVQSNNVTADTWDVYLNGVKLTLLSAPGTPYPFDWSIIAGYTLPAEVIEPLKHIRVYSRLLTATEVYQNYAQPCFSIAETLKGTNSPLQIWGRFNLSSLCNPVSETVNVFNQGALLVNANLNQASKALPNITNNFTVEFWAKPAQPHEIDAQSQSGTAGTSGQQYVIYPDDGGAAATGRAGMGISVGTNGVSVYELATGYMPPLLVWQGDMTAGKHVAVVYNNNTPSLYINGQLVKTGLASTKQYVYPSYNFGGGTYGFMPGVIDEVRIWNVARTAQEISANYQQGITPSSVTGLVGYWPMDPDNGTVVADVSCNHNNVTLPASGYSWVNSGSNIYNTVNRDALNNFIVPFHGMPTTYAYNSLNQVIKQTSPDGGTARFWYDRLGKLAVSQNAEQLQPLAPGASANRYSYTKYDAFDRIVEVGEKVNAGSSMDETTARDNAALQTWMQSGQNSQITQTIYDEAPSYAPGLLTNLRKRISASVVWDGSIGSTRTAATYYSYDFIGNLKTLYQENQQLSAFDAVTGIKRIDYNYDLVCGKVNKLRYQEGKGDQFYYSYRYDADNRLVEASTSRDGLTWNTEATYRYYLHGLLARTELGNNKVQGLDYAYTLQGWLKGINSQQLDATKDMSQDGDPTSAFQWVARDVMSFSLGYFNGDYQAINNSAAAFGMTYQPAPQPNTISGNELFNSNITNATLAINKLDNGALKGYSYRYDQLNRLKQMRMHDLAGVVGTKWDNNSILPAYQEDISYDGNGNIVTYKRNGNVNNVAPVNYQMDNLTYKYNVDNSGNLVNNKLRNVSEDPGLPASNYATDLDGQADDYYAYDNIGNLKQEGTDLNPERKIYWTVYRKIKQVELLANNVVNKRLSYKYDAVGNRIVKSVETPGVSTQYTFYVRDQQGNVLGVYTRNVPTDGSPGNFKWIEQHLYGSSRLGMWHPNIDVTSAWTAPGVGNGQINIGEREYELNNHLGNILATISDSKTGIDVGNNGTIDYYEANVLTASDYYPFGMQMPGRIFNSGNYRYGFNGKENDNEVKGDGNQQDYGMRIYDPRIGKFLSVDPLTKDYPWYTPYQFSGNKPLRMVDLDGAEDSDPFFGREDDGMVLVNLFNRAIDGATNVLIALTYPQDEGWLIRRGLKNQGYNLPDNGSLDVRLSELFDIKKENRQFVIIPERNAMQKLFDLGISALDVAAVFPSKGSPYLAMVKATPLTAGTIADILKTLRMSERVKRIKEFLDPLRGDGVKLSEFEAESGALLEEAYDIKLRELKPGEIGDYAVESGKINGINVAGKTIDQTGVPLSGVGKFKMEKFYAQIKRHLREKQGAYFILIDLRHFSEQERAEVLKHLSDNFSNDASRIITIQ
ncbi:hypothetical protein A3860_25445 [Niastella vici]|uniref:Uncharacterized protein n=1 Tax=Niastella vici TaxID=1703345 RepID=A0A1V9FY21_9BACT|nr:LamG-like jellyroll fold domain-containing protein [Niastella vici]OQP63237.1 hypothetical protein A3860_25445 [Niastella vici]